MLKSLLHRIFKLGHVPRRARRQIQNEGVILQQEGVGGSITFRKFRAPGKYFSLKRNWFIGSIVLTQISFLAFSYSRSVVGIPWSSEKLAELDCHLENENTLYIGFDAATFNDNWCGEIEIRFSTELASEFLQTIEHKAI